MKQAPIPSAVYDVFTEHCYQLLKRELEQDFRQKYPPKFQVGQNITIPNQKQTLWGGWEVFDPSSFTQPLTQPIEGVVQEIFVVETWLHETLFTRNHRGYEGMTIEAVKQEMRQILKRHCEGQGAHPPFYYALKVSNAPFTWSIPEEFCTEHNPNLYYCQVNLSVDAPSPVVAAEKFVQAILTGDQRLNCTVTRNGKKPFFLTICPTHVVQN